MFNYRISNLIIEGYAGTGKTTEIKTKIDELIKVGAITNNDILFLCYNNDIKEKIIKKSTVFNKKNTHTLHSYAYKILTSIDKLPTVFKGINYDIDNMNNNKEMLKTSDFDNLIDDFNYLSDDEIRLKLSELHSSNVFNLPFSTNFKLMIIDEAQDFREDYFRMINRIKAVCSDAKVWIAGDPLQTIYGFQDKLNKNKIVNVFKNPEEILNILDFKRIYLRENFRSNKAILKLVNGFMHNTLKINNDNLYKITDIDIKNKHRKPIVRFFSNRKDEFEYVKREIEKIKNSTVAVIGRYNKDLALYNGKFADNVRISTIHKMKGDEADYVFYVGFNIDKENDEDINNIVYTGLTRAKKRLIITSAYKKFDLSEFFDEETYELIDSQRTCVKEYRQLKKIKKNRNFTYKKVGNSNIDSLSFKVRKDNLPFFLNIKHNSGEKANFVKTMKIKNNILEYSIKEHCVHGIYFNFFNLSILKKNNYSDNDILKFCLNEIYKHFDYRISNDVIESYRLDLNKYYIFNDKKDLNRKANELFRFFKSRKCMSILDNDFKENKINYLKEDNINEFDFENKSLYVNYNRKKYKGFTCAVYKPVIKENENKINNDNLLKVELRAEKNALSKSNVLKDRSVNWLLNNNLDKLFDKWFMMYNNRDLSSIIC